MYQIKAINTIEEIESCPLCPIDQYSWPRKEAPVAYGRIGLLEGRGLLVLLTALEGNPLTRYKEENDPVYEDSAMEVFINFNPDEEELKYINFEMNSFGTMLSQYGSSTERIWLCDLTDQKGTCTPIVQDNQWSVLLEIPQELIRQFHGGKDLQVGDKITFNCYKISQEPAIEHYGSYAPIQHPVPRFHLPEFFAEAIIN